MIPTIKYAKSYVGVDFITSIDEAIQALKNSMVEHNGCHGIFEPGDATRYEFSMLQTRDKVVVISMMGESPQAAVAWHGDYLGFYSWPKGMNPCTVHFMTEIYNRMFCPAAEIPLFDFEIGRAIFQKQEANNEGV